MTTAALGQVDVIAKLVPGGAQNLTQLSDDELLANTRRLVGRSNQLLATLLEHLAEVETRGVHRTRSCASLYTYCIYELRFSEDAAARRSAAARFAKAFPLLLGAIAAGELHLTGLLMIGPHLTPENHEKVLARAKFRTKRELARLIRELNPLPHVPDRIEPLGPASAPVCSVANPTWEQFVISRSPSVRELPNGDRPAAWANDESEVSTSVASPTDKTGGASSSDADAELPVGPVPSDLPPITGPQHFQMQFGTTEEHVQLVERAKSLLARTLPNATLGELHLEAMKMLIAELERRKFAITDQPRKARELAAARGDEPDHTHSASAPPRQRVDEPGAHSASASAEPLQRGDEPDHTHSAPAAPRQCRQRGDGHGASLPAPPRRGRYVAAAVRREVYGRDGGRCSHVDARGVRCRETRHLELHHLQAFARGGENVASNLTLRCAAHNALAAEQDFGASFVTQRRTPARHETLGAQSRSDAFHLGRQKA